MATEYKTASITLAEIIINCASAHEKSFDKAASEAAQAKADAARAANPRNYFSSMVDHSKFYRLNIRQACELCAPEELVQPIYLMLSSSWNDSLEWANSVTKN